MSSKRSEFYNEWRPKERILQKNAEMSEFHYKQQTIIEKLYLQKSISYVTKL